MSYDSTGSIEVEFSILAVLKVVTHDHIIRTVLISLQPSPLSHISHGHFQCVAPVECAWVSECIVKHVTPNRIIVLFHVFPFQFDIAESKEGTSGSWSESYLNLGREECLLLFDSKHSLVVWRETAGIYFVEGFYAALAQCGGMDQSEKTTG